MSTTTTTTTRDRGDRYGAMESAQLVSLLCIVPGFKKVRPWYNMSDASFILQGWVVFSVIVPV